MNKNFLASAILILVVIITGGCSDRGGEDQFKVITFNIRYDNPRDSINAWPNRASMAASFINDIRPDLIGMQEVLAHQYEYLDSALTGYGSVAVGRTDGVRGGEMNPVFYLKDRFDLVRTKTFWLSPTPDVAGSQAWGAGLPRIVTWIELVEKETHDHLYFFNTHFAHDSDSARIMSSHLLLQKVDSISAGSPFVITGDFNQLPDSRGYQILTGPFESVPLLSDTYSVSERRPEGPLYTFNGFSDKVGNGRIDYIFIRPEMKANSHKTFVRKIDGVFISDHWPVMAVVGL